MITEFGKLLRFYRLDNGLSLKDMADELRIPSSYLSAMEMGRKTVSQDFVSKLFLTYNFTEEEKSKIRAAAEMSASYVKLNLSNSSMEQRSAAYNFARKFENLEEETIKKYLIF